MHRVTLAFLIGFLTFLVADRASAAQQTKSITLPFKTPKDPKFRYSDKKTCFDETDSHHICNGTEEQCHKKCESGNANACAYLGCMNAPLFSWSKTALYYFQKSCLSIEQVKCGSLETQIERSLNLDPFHTDPKAGDFLAKLLATACAHDDSNSCSSLGTRYRHGTFGMSKDDKLAHKFLNAACAKNRKECNGIADLYWDKNSTEYDPKKALDVNIKCCHSENSIWSPLCCYRAGLFYTEENHEDNIKARAFMKMSCFMKGGDFDEPSCLFLCSNSAYPSIDKELFSPNSIDPETFKKYNPEAILSALHAYRAFTLCQQNTSSPEPKGQNACEFISCLLKSNSEYVSFWPQAVSLLCVNGQEDFCQIMQKEQDDQMHYKK